MIKKIILLSLFIGFFINHGITDAGFEIISKEDMIKNSKQYEEIKNRKLYYTFESTYIPNINDEKLLIKVDKILINNNNEDPTKLRKIYEVIDKKLDKLGKTYRDLNGKPTSKKNTRIYYLLEQINNKITDFTGNQDLGCVKNIAKAHMEGNKCINNIKIISNETGKGSRSYDYIFKKQWGPIFMTNCNTGYVKKERRIGSNLEVTCVKN